MRFLYGGVRVYGYRTLADPELNPNWTMLSNSRLYTAIAAQANAIAERFTFAELDGQRRKVNEFGGVLAGMLLPYWTRGSLYGATPQEAFNVDVGAQVNTDATLAAGELHAVIALRMSPFAERVILEIVKTAPTEAVA
jgi:phage tail sheath protein FI